MLFFSSCGVDKSKIHELLNSALYSYCPTSPILGDWEDPSDGSRISFSKDCVFKSEDCANGGKFKNTLKSSGELNIIITYVNQHVESSCLISGEISCDYEITNDSDTELLNFNCDSLSGKYLRVPTVSENSSEQTVRIVKGPEAVTRQYSTSNPVFQRYIDQFKNTHKEVHKSDISVNHIPINFGSPNNESFESVCHIYFDGTKEILIRKDWWDRYVGLSGETVKRLMIFHELGHCLLGRKHKNDKIPHDNKEINASIMSATLMPYSDYQKYRAQYDNELFTSSHESLKHALSSQN